MPNGVFVQWNAIVMWLGKVKRFLLICGQSLKIEEVVCRNKKGPIEFFIAADHNFNFLICPYKIFIDQKWKKNNMPMSLPGITSMCMPKMKSIGIAVNAWSTTQTDRQTHGQTKCKNIYIYIYIDIYI